ncbi:hypothetical protein BJ742DRAFT_735211 [Cladochytrium replicatum]|nr:hypothetical protein BJ742DRAFT_735211 [Cladochytrium replicatum]
MDPGDPLSPIVRTRPQTLPTFAQNTLRAPALPNASKLMTVGNPTSKIIDSPNNTVKTTVSTKRACFDRISEGSHAIDASVGGVTTENRILRIEDRQSGKDRADLLFLVLKMDGFIRFCFNEKAKWHEGSLTEPKPNRQTNTPNTLSATVKLFLRQNFSLSKTEVMKLFDRCTGIESISFWYTSLSPDGHLRGTAVAKFASAEDARVTLANFNKWTNVSQLEREAGKLFQAGQVLPALVGWSLSDEPHESFRLLGLRETTSRAFFESVALIRAVPSAKNDYGWVVRVGGTEAVYFINLLPPMATVETVFVQKVSLKGEERMLRVIVFSPENFLKLEIDEGGKQFKAFGEVNNTPH